MMKGNIMSKLKNYIVDIEDQILELNLVNIFNEVDSLKEASTQVCEELNLIHAFDVKIVEDIIGECWNEYWGDFV